VSSNLLIVVDSPPGTISASRALRSSGTRTSTDSTASAARTSRCSRNAPCSARTPIFTTGSPGPLPGAGGASPTPLCQFDVEGGDLLAPHRVTEAARHLGHDRRIAEVRGGFDD